MRSYFLELNFHNFPIYMFLHIRNGNIGDGISHILKRSLKIGLTHVFMYTTYCTCPYKYELYCIYNNDI